MNCEMGIAKESDGALDLTRKGDAAAMDQLFGPCIPRLRKTAARLLRNPYDAEDALQDGLLSAFRHLGQFQGRAQFTTWMHTIVANAAKSKLRSQQSRPFVFSLDESLPEHADTCLADLLVDPQANLDDEYAHVERSRILAAIVDELPKKLRVIVLLCDIEGLRLKEAAEKLGMTVSAVKTRRFRANRLLLKRAKQACAEAGSTGYSVKTAPRSRRPVCRGLGRGLPREAGETKTSEIQIKNHPVIGVASVAERNLQ